MRFLVISIVILAACPAFAFTIKVIFRHELSFTAESLEARTRQNESFDEQNTDPQLESLILATVSQTVKLLPPRYLPPLLTFNVERSALFTKTRKAPELIPLSMVLTSQIPTKNEIRYSDYEMRTHPEAARTIIAHETGHMLIEWACRAEGVTKPTDSTVQSSHWAGSIYEGVADYISATVNNTTIIGTPGAWYARDILKFDTLDAAHKGSISTVTLVEQGWTESGLIPRYQTYVDLVRDFKKQASEDTVGDSYVEAPWLAGQFWKLNAVYGSESVFASILKLAVSGKKFISPEPFLNDVKLALGQSQK